VAHCQTVVFFQKNWPILSPNIACEKKEANMRIFVTGATGFVGSAVVQALLRAGHEVVGLVRSDTAARSLTTAGAKTHRGDLQDLESLRKGAAESDGVIHTGFIHDFSKFKENCKLDRKVIDALGSALAGSNRPLIVTSVIGVLPAGQIATEETRPLSPSQNPRAATEEAARVLIDGGVSISIVRLPPSTHGEGDHGFVPILIKMARGKNASVYIGEGKNTRPAVHRLDAAQVFKLALEKKARGACYHAVAEEGVEFRKIAEVIGQRLGVQVVSKSPEEAAAHFTWFAHFASMNIKGSSKQTQEMLGWHWSQPGLIDDLDQPIHFKV
jgi:nucleoside-diphosphate-sugar epimerase